MDFRSHLSTLERHFSSLPTGSAAEPVEACLQPIINFRQLLWRTDREVTFFGAFKAGKSTLLNAILGEPVLPFRANRATGVVTRISYSQQKTASVLRRGWNTRLTEEKIRHEDLAKYILLDVSGTTSKAFESIEAVSVQIPRSILKNRCILVDTPGLMDDQTLTEQSYRELKRSDLAVMVLSADKLLSLAEKDAVSQVHSLLNGNIVFIVNRLDLVDEEEKEEVLDWARTALVGIGNTLVGQPRIFATKAREALAAKQCDAMRGAALDGILAFEQWLGKLLRSSTGDKIAMLSRLGILDSYLTEALGYFQAELSQAQGVVKNLKEAQANALVEQQASLRRAVMQDRMCLSNFRTQLDGLGREFVRDCTKRVESLMTSNSNWSEQLKDCLTASLQAYTQKVYQGVKSTGLQSNIVIPLFNPSHLNTSSEVTATDDPAETWGFWIGIFLGVAAPGAWFIGAPIGAAVGSWLGKTLFGVDVQQKTLESVESAARSLLPTLRTEAERYVDTIDNLLSDFGKSYKPNPQLIPELRAAEQAEQYYSALVKWCDEFQNTIHNLKKQVVG